MKKNVKIRRNLVLFAVLMFVSGEALPVQADYADVIDAVNNVQNGYLGNYDTVTIAEVLEYVLPDGTWDGEEEDSGGVIVEYVSSDTEIEFSVTDEESTFSVSGLVSTDMDDDAGIYEVKNYLDGLYAQYVEAWPECGIVIDESSVNNTLRGFFASEGVEMDGSDSGDEMNVEEETSADASDSEGEIYVLGEDTANASDSEEEVYILGEDIGLESSEDAASSAVVDWDYASIYGIILNEAQEYSTYILYDIDDDGTKELVLGYGSTADYSNDVWTVDADGERQFVGDFYLPQAFYIAPDHNGIYGVYGHMGYQRVTRITIEGGVIAEEIIDEEDFVEEYYSNNMPITAYDVSDWSGLTASEETSMEQSGGAEEEINIYGTYYYDNGTDNTMTAEIGFTTDDGEFDYLYIEAWSYGDRLTVEFTGYLIDQGDYAYYAMPYDTSLGCELVVVISGDGMSVTVLNQTSDTWMVLEGYYEKTSTLDLYGVS